MAGGCSRRMGIAALLAGAALAAPLLAAEAADPLAAGFADPPASARPRVWWHWMNGNITQDGITRDLEWMARVGIGGLQNFDAALGIPPIVPNRLAFMSPAWKAAFRHTAGLADRLGLELAVAASPGWSETGGPWVAPKDGMKKLVWSETPVPGGRPFAGRLPPPPRATGLFQDLSKDAGAPGLAPETAASPQFYADVAVLAFPVKDGAALAPPRFTDADGTPLDGTALGDDSLATALEIPRPAADRPALVVADYGTPRTLRSARLHLTGAAALFVAPDIRAQLQVSEGDGWRKVADIPLTPVPTTVSFAPVTGARFRVRFDPQRDDRNGLGSPAPGTVIGSLQFTPPPTTLRIADLRFGAEPRINAAELKAGFAIADDYYALDADAGPEVAGVDPTSVIDLTGRMSPDGELRWSPPAGRWRVLRLGYSLTGTTNHPATPEATGLEVDKYDGAAVRAYLGTYLGMYRDAAGDGLIGQRGLRALLTDSTEVGASNWTPRLVERFRALRGYDPTPWLPALTGVVVGSRRQSDAFLYDFRRTLAELVASEHYGQVAAVAREQGLAVYGEALEGGRPTLGDDMAMRRHADIPMAALWTYGEEGPRTALLADIKGAASVAHVYGQNLVAAESLTSAFRPWAHAPRDLKPVIDLAFVTGVNRPVIHTSVHQPVDDKVPGLSLFVFGQFFNRHETWAEMARPWVDYMARSSFLLQRGRHVADVAYFYGEEAPLTALYAGAAVADAPVRHGYDFVNAEALNTALRVEDGMIVSTGGARYRVLYLGGSSRRMTLATLRRLEQLVADGAVVVGLPPEASPALGDDPAAFAAAVRRLWSGAAGGKGRVIAGAAIEPALAGLGVAPDFTYAGPARLLFLHRTLADGEIYFLSNRLDRPERVEARFRVTGRRPELWRADGSPAAAVSYRTEGEHTVVDLDLQAQDAVFVVFRGPAAAPAAEAAPPVETPLAEIGGGWEVSFQPGRGPPGPIRLTALASLSGHAEAGVRYFSGVATYRTSFTAAAVTPGRSVLLDLGQVGDVAEVLVNGRPVGIAWKPPYRVDVGPALRRGRNRLEVRVANLWVNRLIGDAQPGAAPVTYTAFPTYRADAPLRPSGLIGPVRLMARESAR